MMNDGFDRIVKPRLDDNSYKKDPEKPIVEIIGTAPSYSRIPEGAAPNPFMSRAIELARKAGIVDKTGGCFGAVIVKNGVIVGEGWNQVVSTYDPTCHAEISAIRDASKNLKTFHLEGCDIYTSNEPCPMCLGACYWAHLRSVYYAGTIADARDYGNFDDDKFYEELKKPHSERVIMPVHFAEECRCQMISVWKEYQAANKTHY